MGLRELTKNLKTLKERTEQDPFRFFTPTPPQLRFFEDKNPVKILLGGNQIGKTISLCYLMIAYATNRWKYFQIDPPPLDIMLITYSHDQRRIIEKKLWEMLPKDEIHDTIYIQGKGLKGITPVVKFKNGSTIYIRTSGMGLALESATLNLIVIDEPISEMTYNSCIARIIRGGKGYGPNGKRGTLVYSCTPVGGIDTSYIKKLIEDKQISAHYGKLTVADTTPIGCRPLLLEADIKKITDSFLAVDREARISGSLEGIATQNIIYDCFDNDMISPRPVQQSKNIIFSIGIDHGTLPNSQVAILTAIDMEIPAEPKVWVLDEYVSGGAPAEFHAENILNMLERHEIPPAGCMWTGDGEHTGSRGKGKSTLKMSNILLMRAFERLLGLPYKRLPFRIRQAIKYRHSVYFGASVIHSIMSRRHFRIHPRCKKTIHSIRNWTMKRNQSERSRDPAGHCCDALRYAIVSCADMKRGAFSTPQKITLVR